VDYADIGTSWGAVIASLDSAHVAPMDVRTVGFSIAVFAKVVLLHYPRATTRVYVFSAVDAAHLDGRCCQLRGQSRVLQQAPSFP